MKSNLEFDGKVALITGGNSGIGAAAVSRVAELGAQVVITGSRQREGQMLESPVKTGCSHSKPRKTLTASSL